jgi:hypothetical protein
MSSSRMDLQHGSARNSLPFEQLNSSATKSRTSPSPLSFLMKQKAKKPRLTIASAESETRARNAGISCLSRSANFADFPLIYVLDRSASSRIQKINNVSGRPVYVKETPVILPVLSTFLHHNSLILFLTLSLGKGHPNIAPGGLVDLDEDAPDISVLKGCL